MTLIFVNRFFYPDHSATSQMLSDLAFALAAERSHAVTVVTSRQRYDAPQDALPPQETVDGVTIHRVWTSRFGRDNLALRAVDYLTFYLSAAIVVWRLARRGDVVIAKTDPPMLSVALAPITAVKRARLINWLQDLFPEVAQELGAAGGGLTRGAFRTLRALRDASLKRAACNVAIGDRMAARLESLGVDPARIAVIPNWADGALVHPVHPRLNRLRQAWGLTDAFVVGYSGNLGRAHEVETMIAAIERVAQQSELASVAMTHDDKIACPEGIAPVATPPPAYRAVRWLFIGGGAQFERLRREVERRNLRSVSFQPYQPRERLAESLSAADVHLISLLPALEGLIVPSKYYGIAAAGRPAIFIGESDGEIARILERSETGVTVAPGDGAALADAILGLAAEPERAATAGARARALFERDFDHPHALAQWQGILADAGSPGS